VGLLGVKAATRAGRRAGTQGGRLLAGRGAMCKVRLTAGVGQLCALCYMQQRGVLLWEGCSEGVRQLCLVLHAAGLWCRRVSRSVPTWAAAEGDP
jgi:hypothetical protein